MTLFGESTGSGAVDYLTTSQITNPPFRAAILQSDVSAFTKIGTVGGDAWKHITKSVHYEEPAQLDCMRKINAKRLKDIQERDFLAFNNVIDNYTVFAN